MSAKPMTVKRLAAIRARLRGVSTGPWTALDGQYHHGHHGRGVRCYMIGDMASIVAVTPSDAELDRADAVFLAHCRADVPALLAEVKRLRVIVGEPTR